MTPVVAWEDPPKVLKKTSPFAVEHGALGFLQEALSPVRSQEAPAHDAIGGHHLAARGEFMELKTRGLAPYTQTSATGGRGKKSVQST